QQLGVAIRVAGHQRTDLDSRGLLGPGAEHGPAFEMRAVGIAVQREEVVPVEGDVDPDVFASADGVAQMTVVGRVLGLQLDTDADGQIRMRRGHPTTVGNLRTSVSIPLAPKYLGASRAG